MPCLSTTRQSQLLHQICALVVLRFSETITMINAAKLKTLKITARVLSEEALLPNNVSLFVNHTKEIECEEQQSTEFRLKIESCL